MPRSVGAYQRGGADVGAYEQGAPWLLDMSLPQTLSSTAVQADFIADGTMGVIFDEQRHMVGGTVAFETSESVATIQGADRSLWKMKGYLKIDGSDVPEAVEFGPSDAAEFSSYGPIISGESKSLIFEWRGVTPPGSTDRLWVRISATMQTQSDDFVEWHGWFGREAGDNLHVQEFVYPWMVVKGFSSERGGDANHYEAQARTRFMFPNALNSDDPFQFSNYPMNCVNNLIRRELTGLPSYSCGGVVKMPWMVLCSGDDLDALRFRRNLSVRARRVSSHPISVWFQLGGDAAESPTESFISMGLGQIAPAAYDHGPAIDRYTRNPTHWRNSFGPKHATLTECFTSKTNEFWYDICFRHRDDYAALFPTPTIENNPNLSPVTAGPRHLYATWSDRILDRDEENIMNEDYSKFGAIIRELSESIHTDFKSVAHQQSPFHYQGAAVTGEGYPEEEKSIKPDWIGNNVEQIAKLGDMGFLCTIYTAIQPYGDPASWREWKLQKHTTARGPTLQGLRYDNDQIRSWEEHLTGNVAGAIADLGLNGIYCDVHTGVTYILYSEGSPRIEHHGGGGDHSTMIRRQNLIDMRDKFRAINPDFVVMSENSEEFISDVTDASQDGYMFQTGHFSNLEETMALGEFGNPWYSAVSVKTDYPVSFRQMHPNLMKICHKERFPSFKFTVDLTNQCLDTVVGGGFGITAAEMKDSFCFARALMVATGEQQIMHTTYLGNLFACVQLRDGRLVTDPVDDPTGAGLVMTDFMKTVYESMVPSYGGHWILTGRILRDLEVDWATSEVQNNPAAAYRKMPGWVDGEKVIPHGNWPAYSELNKFVRFGNADFDVLSVLHTVVVNVTTGRVALILVNWTDHAADWTGTLDLNNFDEVPTTYDVERLNLGGSPTAIASGLTGTNVFRSEASDPGGVVYLGHLPARSVSIFELKTP